MSIEDLKKVEGIGDLTAKCLVDFGCNTPEQLKNTSADSITKKFIENKGKPGCWNYSREQVNKWIEAAKTNDWKFSIANEKRKSIKTRVDGYKEKYNRKIDFEINPEMFKVLFKDDDYDRQCEYCHIKESEIKELIDANKIIQKQLKIRGKRMEIDRRDPSKGYIYGPVSKDNNIAICCYWCNNAKTDEFDDKDFIPIGEAIRKVWEKRLGRKIK